MSKQKRIPQNSKRGRVVRNSVPKGYRHDLDYRGRWKERKIAPGLWRGRFTALKKREGSPKGGLKVGHKIGWRVYGTQTATKVGGRSYLTDFRFTKRLVRRPR